MTDRKSGDDVVGVTANVTREREGSMADQKAKRLTVYLQPDIWEKLQRCSNYYGLNYSQLLTASIWRNFTRNKRNIELIEATRPLILEEQDVENLT